MCAPPGPTNFVGMTFQDPSGAPLAGGRVVFRLTQDGNVGGIQVPAGREVSIPLDNNGFFLQKMFLSAEYNPPTTYFIIAYTAKGEPVWRQETAIVQYVPPSDHLLQEDGTSFFLLETSPGSILLEV